MSFKITSSSILKIKVNMFTLPGIITALEGQTLLISLDVIYIEIPSLTNVSQTYRTPIGLETYYKNKRYSLMGSIKIGVLIFSEAFRQLSNVLRFGSKINLFSIRKFYINERGKENTLVWYEFNSVIESIGSYKFQTDKDARIPTTEISIKIGNVLGLHNTLF